MATTIHLTHEYDYDACLVWSISTEFKYFEIVMKGLATFKGLPEGQLFEGQELDVEVSVFGLLPFQPYFMKLEQCDHKAHKFISAEKGHGIKSWRHRLSVVPNMSGSGCKIIEDIEIDAGKLTFIFALWAKYMYTARHKRRLALLKQLENGNS